MKKNIDSELRSKDSSNSFKYKPIRLNKFISNAGVCSRREADQLIKLGMVNVNGKIITEMGHKILPTDKVKYDGQTIKAKKPSYILLNKPKGFLGMSSGKTAKKTVQDLVNIPGSQKLTSIGDMGRTVTGLLILTDDLSLRKKIIQSKKGVRMIYKIVLDNNITKSDIDIAKKPHRIFDKEIQLKDVSHVAEATKKDIGVECFNIPPSVIIKLFKKINYTVEQLDRVVYGSLSKKELPRGKWRELTSKELNFLQML
ncbi:MAG: S4 domain-containing protein [Flavobacteriaceae bacterium]|nr:S4 domain-containing protein [Flavobacteriaceae bacterium]